VSTITLPSEPFKLTHSSHGREFKGCACASELISVMSGLPFSDNGDLLDPPVNRLAIALNERLHEGDEIARLLPILPYTIGTKNDGREKERQKLCTEWLLHTTLPRWLEFAGEPERAAAIRALPGDPAVEGVLSTLRDVRQEMWTKQNTALEPIRKIVREAVEAEFKKRGLKVVAAEAAVAAGAAVAVGAAGAAEADWRYGGKAYNTFRRVFREKLEEAIRPKLDEQLREMREQTLTEGLELFRKLGNETVREDLIVIENWREVCGIAA